MTQHYSSDITCNGANNGEIQVNVIGGVAPYSYVWTLGNIVHHWGRDKYDHATYFGMNSNIPNRNNEEIDPWLGDRCVIFASGSKCSRAQH